MKRVITSNTDYDTRTVEERTADFVKCYGVPESVAEIGARITKDKLNTADGYALYFELVREIEDLGVRDAGYGLLADVAANFNWDDALSDNFEALCKANNRLDLLDKG